MSRETAVQSRAFAVGELRCEYRVNPLGIDVLRPRLSWQLTSDRRGTRQTAYQLLAASSKEALDAGSADLWDTSRVPSDRSIHVPYEGAPLGSAQRAWWKVRVWDERGQQTESELAWWEMGLLHHEDWKATWIGAALAGSPGAAVPCPYLRQKFAIERPIVSARLYVTALGLYEFTLNGRRIGEDVFTPGWTDYHKRIQYQVYDVTSDLILGENAAGVILGDGWYCGNLGFAPRQVYGNRPKLLAQIVVKVEGSDEPIVIATDGSWQTAVGPLVESDPLMGECYDASQEFPRWDRPGFDARNWHAVQTFPDTGTALVAMRCAAVRATQELQAVADPWPIASWPYPQHIFDLGQNMVGRVRLKVQGTAGATIRLRYGEALDERGHLYTANLRAARCTDHYTLRGDPAGEVYEPHFTFHGFRYVEVTNWPGTPTRDGITGIVLHSDTPQTGEFECSDPLVNQLQRNIDWSQRGNFLEVPTDCPQRDERLGWTGDAQVFIRTACFNRDVAGFFTKWQRDIADAQKPDGSVPAVIPNVHPNPARAWDGGPAWADAAVICPWTLYLCYGDIGVLEEHYPSLTKFMEYLQSVSPGCIRGAAGTGVWTGFGDWLSINAQTRPEVIGTAFLAYSAHLMSQIAGVLNKNEDARRYADLFERVREAFCRRFVTPDGLLANETQAACVLALHFDLVPEEQRATLAAALVADIRRRGMHLSTGFVGSPYLSHVLTATGHLDVAYALLHQKSWPSWLYAVTQGATTIWERWDGWTKENGFQDPTMNSLNHYAYGAIGAWLYSAVAGIDVDPHQPGYKHIVMVPHPGGELRSASGTLNSMYGRIESAWRVENDVFKWHVCVPANATATVTVPTDDPLVVRESGQPATEAEGVVVVRAEPVAAVYELASGAYDFEAPLTTRPDKP